MRQYNWKKTRAAIHYLESQSPLPPGTVDAIDQAIDQLSPQHTHPLFSYHWLFLCIPGALLIGGGIIALLANNWATIPPLPKLILACLPQLLTFVIYSALFWKKRLTHPIITETLALFWSCSIIATATLIGRIYQLPSSSLHFTLLCTCLIAPLTYLLKSQVAGLITGIFFFCSIGECRTITPLFIALAFFIPFFWQHQKSYFCRTLLAVYCLANYFFLTELFINPSFYLLLIPLGVALLYERHFLYRPLEGCMLIALGAIWIENVVSLNVPVQSLILDTSLILLFLALALTLKRFPIAIFIAGFALRGFLSPYFISALTCLSLILLGTFTTKHRLPAVLGFGGFLLLIVNFFLNSPMDFTAKGLTMISVGILCFLLIFGWFKFTQRRHS